MKTATALRDIYISEYNVKTSLGNRGRKPFYIHTGDALPVLHEFISDGMATHGDRYLKLQASPYTVYVLASDFQVEE